MNVPGFNVQAPSAAPFQMLPPEVLAQLAAASFRPPAQMQSPAIMREPQGGGGFGLGDGLAMAGMGLGMLGKNPAGWVPSTSGSEPGRTAGDADLGGYGGSPVNPMGGNPNAVPQIFNPSGNALTQPDFLTGAWRKITGLF